MTLFADTIDLFMNYLEKSKSSNLEKHIPHDNETIDLC